MNIIKCIKCGIVTVCSKGNICESCYEVGREKTREEKLQELVDVVKKESFESDYKATNQEALGILISTYFEWSGEPVIETAMLALENSNFHHEASKLLTMLNHLNDKK